jgi:hypothetical protein
VVLTEMQEHQLEKEPDLVEIIPIFVIEVLRFMVLLATFEHQLVDVEGQMELNYVVELREQELLLFFVFFAFNCFYALGFQHLFQISIDQAHRKTLVENRENAKNCKISHKEEEPDVDRNSGPLGMLHHFEYLVEAVATDPYKEVRDRSEDIKVNKEADSSDQVPKPSK